MIDRAGLADFLRRRREALQPEDVGLARGARRRTGGLRREEVAALSASGEVHDRMPAFVTPDLWETYLDPTPLTVDGDTHASTSNRDELLALLEHSSQAVARTMRTHLVDRRFNNSRTVDKWLFAFEGVGRSG